MDTVERVEQKDETHLHWTANIGGRTVEYAEVVESRSSPTTRCVEVHNRGVQQRPRPPAAVAVPW
jgi:hypothetical protein